MSALTSEEFRAEEVGLTQAQVAVRKALFEAIIRQQGSVWPIPDDPLGGSDDDAGAE